MHNKASIVGFVRYSQKITFKGGAKDVFEPAYFEYRFKIFKEVTLKSFQQQSDQDFVLLVLHSDTMPPRYKERFKQLEIENPFLYNVFTEDNVNSFNEAVKNSITYVAFKEDVALTFRIDNDDAVCVDFIHNLRGLVKKEFVGFTICIPTVIIVKRVAEQSYMIEERYYPSNSIGLAYVTGSDEYKTVLQVAEHHRMNEHNPLLLLPQTEIAGLMTINGENAANAIDHSRIKVYNSDELSNHLNLLGLDNLDLKSLRVFNEPQISTESIFKRGMRLMMPPVFFTIYRSFKTKIN